MKRIYGQKFYDVADAPAAGAPPVTPPAGSPPAAGTPPIVQPAADWISGIKNEEVRGFIQNKGFKDPEILADSYRNLEKLMGAPKEQLLKLPTDFNTPEGEQVWQRLGKPEKADGYQFEVPKDATPADKEFVEFAKGSFHKSNLTTEQAKTLANEWNAFQTAAAQKQAQAIDAQNKVEFESLKTEWGNAYEQKFAVTVAAAKEFGLTEAQLDGIQKVVGYSKTMKLFSDIGSKLGESSFVPGNGRTGTGPLDVSSAKAAVALKKADAAYMAKYVLGNTPEYHELSKLIADANPGNISIG